MIDWDKIARERGFKKHHRNFETDEVWEEGDPKAMLEALYKEHKSLDGIASELLLSRHTVRIAFERYQIEVKTQGGAQYVKFEVTDDLLDEIETCGVTAVARRLGVDYTSVYKRTRDARRKRKELRTAQEQSDSASQGEKGTPPHGEDQ